MNCEQFREELELYALGVLEREPANLLAAHLATGCSDCQQGLRRALEHIRFVSSTVPLLDPPPRLRRRLHEAIAPAAPPRRRWLPWAVAVAAMLLLAVSLSQQYHSLSLQSAAQARTSTMMQILGASGTQSVAFTDPEVPNLHGTLYVHQRLGIALIVDHLPNAPAGWDYESWLVPKSGAAVPVESFQPDDTGRAVSLVRGPVNLEDMGALAVSMEPKDSRPIRPTKLVFAART